MNFWSEVFARTSDFAFSSCILISRLAAFWAEVCGDSAASGLERLRAGLRGDLLWVIALGLRTTFWVWLLMAGTCAAESRPKVPVGVTENSPLPPLEQKMQPRVPLVPSRLGQVQPISTESLYTLQPKSVL